MEEIWKQIKDNDDNMLARRYYNLQDKYNKLKDLFKKYENEHFIPKAEIQKLLEETNE